MVLHRVSIRIMLVMLLLAGVWFLGLEWARAANFTELLARLAVMA